SFGVCNDNLRLADGPYDGFTFDQSTVAAPGCVWFEGTTSMALAYAVAEKNTKANYFFTQVSNSMKPNGGIAYTTFGNGDTNNGVQTNASMASASWFVLFDQSPRVNPFQPSDAPVLLAIGGLPIIDDFEDAIVDYNSIGNPNQHSPNITVELVTNDPCGGEQALKLTYDSSTNWAAWWTFISCDISSYKELSFCVKGETGANQFFITINDEKEVAKVITLSEFLPFGVSDTWQTVTISLNKFIDFKKINLTKITTLSFTFEGKDTIYLDQIRLTVRDDVMDKMFGSGDVFQNIKMDRNILSPNGDGLSDTVCFEVYLNGTGTIDLEIYDMRGSLVKKFSQSGSEAQFCWDGKDSSNRSLANGLYIYQIIGKDSNGKEQELKKLILLEK
ncbi:MAG: gliding motility-associated C-terminal domain-containing protein, partial [Spirochaetes bacterium]|nr:gliding motility-associated C-terminal domain-containing protein [Spirochaetota bacterium]